MKYYLAIDIGASSGRHILAHMEGGRMVTEEIYRFSNGPKAVFERNGQCLTWDSSRLFKEILIGLKRAKELGKIPDFVAVDTWGVDYALLGERDEPIGEIYCYRDRTDKDGRSRRSRKDSLFAAVRKDGNTVSTFQYRLSAFR